jgi:hypothetical protein
VLDTHPALQLVTVGCPPQLNLFVRLLARRKLPAASTPGDVWDPHRTDCFPVTLLVHPGDLEHISQPRFASCHHLGNGGMPQ